MTDQNSHLYEPIWQKHMPEILLELKKSRPSSLSLNASDFHEAGNRKRYAFKLEIEKNTVTNNIKGSAVARDLLRVLQRNEQFNEVAQSNHLIFRMDKEFRLYIDLFNGRFRSSYGSDDRRDRRDRKWLKS